MARFAQFTFGVNNALRINNRTFVKPSPPINDDMRLVIEIAELAIDLAERSSAAPKTVEALRRQLRALRR